MSIDMHLTEPLARVYIDGIWVINQDHQEHIHHYHLGNHSVCRLSLLLTSTGIIQSYKISRYPQRHCNVCIKVKKKQQIIAQINADRKKFEVLYKTQNPEHAVMCYITHPDIYPAALDAVIQILKENYPEFGARDVLAFMVIGGLIALDGQYVTVPNGGSS